ncbi:hypothetical protein P3W45_001603 [Vairimorpha bombi]|jgi:hypothetical protein
MDFVSASKSQELALALQNRHNSVIIVSGPSGCLKTSMIASVLSSMNLVSEYIEDISLYKSKLLSKSSVCLTDIDDMDYFVKNKSKISSMSNLIIETRSLPYIYKSFSRSVSISMSKISNTSLRRFYKFTDDILKIIDGNMHRLDFYKYTLRTSYSTIYKHLNILYGTTKQQNDQKQHNDQKIIKYLFSNSLFFVDLSSLYDIHESISLTDYRIDEFYLYSVDTVRMSKKKELRKFMSMKSWVYEEHYSCNEVCQSYKYNH